MVSAERVRLPFIMAGKIVLVWVSSVPRGSLGLLLGKDALDAWGAMIDFMGNRLQLQLLAPNKWIPLKKLKAGHFAIPCLPTPLSRWPPLSDLAWIAVGKDCCCEVQVASKEKWLLKRLTRSREVAAEAEVTEHFSPAAFLELNSLDLPCHAARTSMDPSWQPAAGDSRCLQMFQMFTRLMVRVRWRWNGILLWLIQRPISDTCRRLCPP